MITIRKANAFVLTFFFLSGLCGLIYEIVWMRMLRLVMGNTVFSAATVLTAFMGGLALGSYLAGLFIDRRNDALRIYGILEGLVGVYCLILPWIIDGTEPLYKIIYQNYHASFLFFSLLRFLICGAILLIPATLMGATLPVLSKYFADNLDRLGWTIGKLYSINTFGAVLGAFITGFFLIPKLGVRLTLYSGVLINLLIFLWVLILYNKVPYLRVRAIREDMGVKVEGPGTMAWIVLLGIGLGGFASMVYEVAWTRTLSLTIGSSVYAFSLMLTAFIFGIGLGSAVFSRFIDRREDLALLFGIVETVIGLSALVMVPIFGRLPMFIVNVIVKYSRSFELLYLIEFLMIFLLMLVPTTMMGAAFPIASKIYTKSIQKVGRSIGVVYSSNTLGALLGSFSGGFILIPLVGIQKAIVTAVLINIAVGIAFFSLSWSLSRFKRGLIVATAAAVALFWCFRIPQWDRAVLSSGAYLYAYKYEWKSNTERADLDEVMRMRRKILYHKEGITTTVTVTESGGEVFLKVNGKTDASSKGDMRTQSLLSHLPLLLHRNPEKVLLIGLGSGVSLGSIEQHPVKAIDCVEISPEVVEGSEYFREVNHNALDDTRANLIVGDGRNHVALTDERYDLIISQPSNLWISGMADLFTREFFQLCSERLREGGMMCQWVQAYLMSNRDFRVVLRTFNSVFPHVSLWESDSEGDYFLIGSHQKVGIDYGILSERMRNERVRTDMESINVIDPPSLLSCFVTAGEGITQLGEGVPVHTDDNALLEFSAPKSLYRNLYETRDAFQLKDIEKYRTVSLPFLTNLRDGSLEEKIRQAYQAKLYSLRGRAYEAEGKLEEAIAEFERALAINPHDIEASYLLPKIYFENGYRYMQSGEYKRAIVEYRKGMDKKSDDANAHRNLGLIYEREGMYDEAEREYKRAIEIYPDFAYAHNDLGGIYARRLMYDDAVEEYKKAIEIDPDIADVHHELGNIYYRRRMYKEAADEYRRALEIDPDHLSARNNLAGAYAALGMYKEAREEWERALKIDPDNKSIMRNLKRLKQRGY